jgi:diguanylate cyclase (GGDEF)-like protein
MRALMSARGRFTCLLAILTILGGTIFGVTGALGRGDPGHGGGSGPTNGQRTGSPGWTGGGITGGPITVGTGGTLHVGGGPGDAHGGPPTTGGGPGDHGSGGGPGDHGTGGGPGNGNGGPPTTGGGTDGGGSGGLTDGPPKVVPPPPTTGGGPPPLGDGNGGGGPRDHGTGGGGTGGDNGGGNPGGPGLGDGHDHGKHHSIHGPGCTGTCHTGNDHQTSGVQVPTTSPTPVATQQTAPPQTAPPPRHHQQPSFTFSSGPPSLVQVHTPTPNPGASSAGLGSAPAIGATIQASSSGLGLLAPATANVGLHGGSGSGHASAPTQLGGPAGAHLLDSSGVGSSAILQVVGFVPTIVWIALGSCILLAALGGGVAVLNRRDAARTLGQLERERAVAKTDPLTGVLNRRGFTEAVERELARARRHDRPFVLAYVDVRGLKAVNDTEGHLAGDELLKTVATLLTESARADDVVGRIGGDELGLLLVEQSGDSAAAVTGRLEAQVSARRSALGLRTPWDLTVGTAAFPEDGGTFDDLVAAADRRLYEQRGIALADSRA